MNHGIFTGAYKVGILGGGQLGQMLIQSGISYNIAFHILDPSAEAPCYVYDQARQGLLLGRSILVQSTNLGQKKAL